MKYTSAAGFRRALEERLRARGGGDGPRISRDRKRVAFDRLLARLVMVAPGHWVLKGGFALDLRLAERARSTKDIDVAWQAQDGAFLDALIDAATCDLGDFFTFNVERTNDPPDRLGGTHRFRVTASLAGRAFETFLLDVGHDDELVGAEMLTTPDLLAFAGIEPVTVPAIPLVLQVAEKLHAYTRVYDGGRTSSRTKDLVDLALIAQLFSLDAVALQQAIKAIFVYRATSEQPPALPPPPAQWRVPFRQLALTVGLDADLDTGQAIVAAMLDPILDHRITSGTWDPDSQRWTGELEPPRKI